MASGRPGKPPPLPRSRTELPFESSQCRNRDEAVQHVAARDLLGCSQRRQVDGRVPGDKQPNVAVDSGSRRGRAGQFRRLPIPCRAWTRTRWAAREDRVQTRGAVRARPSSGSMTRRNAAGEGTDQEFVHARTTLTICSVPAPCGVTFLAPPAFQFSPAVRFVRSDLSDRRSRRGYRTRTGAPSPLGAPVVQGGQCRDLGRRGSTGFSTSSERSCGFVEKSHDELRILWMAGLARRRDRVSRPRSFAGLRPATHELVASLRSAGPQPSLVRALTGRPMLRRTTSITSSV